MSQFAPYISLSHLPSSNAHFRVRLQNGLFSLQSSAEIINDNLVDNIRNSHDIKAIPFPQTKVCINSKFDSYIWQHILTLENYINKIGNSQQYLREATLYTRSYNQDVYGTLY